MIRTEISKKSNSLVNGYFYIIQKLQTFGMPLLLLIIRISIARVFFLSGLTKISNWDATLFLFKNEYMVPLIPTSMAAYLSAFNELFFPLLIVIGFATRFATIPLLVMTLVIQLTYESSLDHLYW